MGGFSNLLPANPPQTPTQKPLFDMSKAVPLTPAEHPLFDMSKAVPINASAANVTSGPQKTVRALQQGMGGPPMFVDVPEGQKESFERAGQAGYQKGGAIGAGLVAGAGTLGALALPTATGTATVSTGLLNPAGEEILKDVSQYGPSLLQQAITNPVVQHILLRYVGPGTGLYILHKLGVLGGREEP